ncbi:eukaryotic translation elongation factor 1 epsilon-1 isoform X2 [Rhinoraja longicauda]
MAVPAGAELAALEQTLGLGGDGERWYHQNNGRVPELQTNNGLDLEGLATIASHVVKEAKKEELLGTTPEMSAIVQQWLEYRVTQIDQCNTQDDKRTILKAGLTHEDREKYVNVSRWFNHIQHYPGVRQYSAPIIFMKNRLYPTVH